MKNKCIVKKALFLKWYSRIQCYWMGDSFHMWRVWHFDNFFEDHSI